MEMMAAAMGTMETMAAVTETIGHRRQWRWQQR